MIVEKKDIMAEIISKKKKLLTLKVKHSAGANIPVKNFSLLRKDIARLLTKLNNKK